MLICKNISHLVRDYPGPSYFRINIGMRMSIYPCINPTIGKSKIGTTTASILDGASQNPVKDTEEKEEGEKKNPRSQMDKPAAPRKPSKVSSESYDAAFLKRNEIKTRQCVYISREIHKRISRIVSVLAKHELTVGGYIDLILERHLEENQEEINGLLRKEIDDWNV